MKEDQERKKVVLDEKSLSFGEDGPSQHLHEHEDENDWEAWRKSNLSTSINPTAPTLSELAVLVLQTSDPFAKVQATLCIGHQHLHRHPFEIGHYATPPDMPPRPESMKVIQPSQDSKRGKGETVASRIKILHSLANIELVAIDLAWDLIARFSNRKDEVPVDLFNDFVKVAMDEAKHFTLLNNRLKGLNSFFGAYPVHNSLWDSATQTAHSLLARLAIVHMIHEARGLDVNPATIAKFERAGDMDSVKVLEVIHGDEIHHVAYGHKWFEYLAPLEHPGVDKYDLFHQTAKKHFRGPLKPPFNEEDRLKAGLDRRWYGPLEKAW